GQVPPPPGPRSRIRAPLRELLVSGPAHVKQQLAVLIRVAVDRDGRAFRRPLLRWLSVAGRADIGQGEPDRCQNIGGCASGLALEHDGLLCALRDAQAGALVLVSWASRHEVAGLLADAIELAEDQAENVVRHAGRLPITWHSVTAPLVWR